MSRESFDGSNLCWIFVPVPLKVLNTIVLTKLNILRGYYKSSIRSLLQLVLIPAGGRVPRTRMALYLGRVYTVLYCSNFNKVGL